MEIITKILGQGESVLRRLKNKILRSKSESFREVEKWYTEDPRGLKRSEFEFLDENSVVFDLGGYEGEWTSNIFARYCPTVYVFEPVTEYAQVIQHRFKKNPKIHVVAAGLASETKDALITLNEFESKVVASGDPAANTQRIELININVFLLQNDIDRIELMKINIEGAEYDLLEYMGQTGLLRRIDTLLIQFHPWSDNALNRRKLIKQQLEKEHVLLFDYPFIWECWQLKNR